MNVQTADWASIVRGWGELLLCDKTSKWKATITIYKTTVFLQGHCPLDKCTFSDVLIKLTSAYDIVICVGLPFLDYIALTSLLRRKAL